MRLRYFILIVALIVLIGLNIAGQGITSVVGDGPWGITSFKFNEGYLVLGLFGREITFAITEIGTFIVQILRKIYHFIR